MGTRRGCWLGPSSRQGGSPVGPGWLRGRVPTVCPSASFRERPPPRGTGPGTAVSSVRTPPVCRILRTEWEDLEGLSQPHGTRG